MPATVYYTVTRTQQVRVAANKVTDAMVLADAAFEHGVKGRHEILGKPEQIWGHAMSEIKTSAMVVTVD